MIEMRWRQLKPGERHGAAFPQSSPFALMAPEFVLQYREWPQGTRPGGWATEPVWIDVQVETGE